MSETRAPAFTSQAGHNLPGKDLIARQNDQTTSPHLGIQGL